MAVPTPEIGVVKNNVGAAFLPNWGIDIDLEIGQGFQAKLSSNSVLEIIGTQLMPELTPIELDLGWNMIAYLREEPADVLLVFQEIAENITIVKDRLGNVYFPDWNFCNISAMVPGEGYQIKMSDTDTLEYLSNDEEY